MTDRIKRATPGWARHLPLEAQFAAKALGEFDRRRAALAADLGISPDYTIGADAPVAFDEDHPMQASITALATRIASLAAFASAAARLDLEEARPAAAVANAMATARLVTHLQHLRDMWLGDKFGAADARRMLAAMQEERRRVRAAGGRATAAKRKDEAAYFHRELVRHAENLRKAGKTSREIPGILELRGLGSARHIRWTSPEKVDTNV